MWSPLHIPSSLKDPKKCPKMDFMGTSEDHLLHMNGFQVHDYNEDQNFDYCDLIPGENHHQDQVVNLDCNLVSGYMLENQLPSMPKELFDYNSNAPMGRSGGPNIAPNNWQYLVEIDEEEDDMEDSSGATTATTSAASKKPKKVDRSRTLISERRRRGRMKEKLYSLRSIVPNITKMDKASIVGDAVQYVQDLQSRAKKLKAEVSSLEASLVGTERYQGPIENQRRIQNAQNNLPICKNLMQIDVFQVEERGFYVKVVCNKGQGVAMSLYKALESLTSYNVQNSNLATQSDRYVFTFTLHVQENEPDMNLPNLKLWVTGALLNQGFELRTPLCS